MSYIAEVLALSSDNQQDESGRSEECTSTVVSHPAMMYVLTNMIFRRFRCVETMFEDILETRPNTNTELVYVAQCILSVMLSL